MESLLTLVIWDYLQSNHACSRRRVATFSVVWRVKQQHFPFLQAQTLSYTEAFNMCTYVILCMYVCIHKYTYVWYVSVSVCLLACLPGCLLGWLSVCPSVCQSIMEWNGMYVSMYPSKQVCRYACMYIYIYIYLYVVLCPLCLVQTWHPKPKTLRALILSKRPQVPCF